MTKLRKPDDSSTAGSAPAGAGPVRPAAAREPGLEAIVPQQPYVSIRDLRQMGPVIELSGAEPPVAGIDSRVARRERIIRAVCVFCGVILPAIGLLLAGLVLLLRR